MDPMLLYLFGLTLKGMGNREASFKIILESLARFPWNHSGWVDLVSLVAEGDQSNLDPHLMDQLDTGVLA